jgi:hypothetical protein
MDEKYKSLWKIRELHDLMIQEEIQSWLNYEFLTFHWWILVAFLILPWVLWYFIADRKRLLETFLVCFFVIVPTTYLDALGNDLRFWFYPTQLIPLAPRAVPFDMSMVPVAYMFIYQFFQSWRSYTIALFIMAALFAFIGEPLSHKLELVLYIKWNYFYSFIYYVLLGNVIKAVLEKLKKLYRP